MKLSSSVVTTSSTWKWVFSNAGPRSNNAPAAIAAAIINGNITKGGTGSEALPTATAVSAPT